MISIALTGSIASGKSEVSRILREMRLPVFDADAAVHTLYEDGTAARRLPDAFAPAISGQQVDRAALSRLLLRDPSLFASLEAAIHPLVKERQQRFFADARDSGAEMAIADIPLLFEKDRASEFDVTVAVLAPEELRKARALARPGMTQAKLTAIMARQLPDAEKRRRAHYVIDNDDDLEALARRTAAVIEAIRRDRS